MVRSTPLSERIRIVVPVGDRLVGRFEQISNARSRPALPSLGLNKIGKVTDLIPG